MKTWVIRCLLALVLTAALDASGRVRASAARLSANPPVAREHDARTYDRWYVMELAGARAGWMHELRRVEGNRIISRSQMQLTIRRGEATIEVWFESEFVERPDGTPLSMRSEQRLGGMPVVQEYTFGAGVEGLVRVRTTTGGQTAETEQPGPEGEWMTPAAAAEYIRKRLESGSAEIVVRTVEPLLGLTPAVTTRRVLERTQAEALGKVVPAIKWAVTTDRQPGIESIEYVDDRGVTISTRMELGGLAIRTVLADRDLALSKADAPELMVSTFVKPDRAIESPRRVRRGVYVLRSRSGPLADLPETGGQWVERIDAQTLRVTVEAGARRAAAADEADDRAYVEGSIMVSSDDAVVRRLAKAALEGRAGGAPAADRAERLRTFVHGHIERKTLGVGFASAAEVARTRAGDCSEHATLLAAMLRAKEIPSRVVSGLIYADSFAGSEEIFGYHMWTQALVEHDGERCWIDLDATLPDGTPFDATHIALVVTSLGDEETTNAMVRLAPLISNLDVRVEAAEAEAPAGAR